MKAHVRDNISFAWKSIWKQKVINTWTGYLHVPSMFRVTSLRRVLNKDARVEVLIDLETIRWKSELFVAQDDQDYLDSLVANLMTEILLQKCPSQIKGLIMKSSLNLLQKKKP